MAKYAATSHNTSAKKRSEEMEIEINPMKLKFVCIIFKNLVRTAKKTPHLTVTKINWLTLFKEIIAVYSKNHTKPTNTMCRQNAVC
jgi:hypothetical protein